MDDSRSLTRAQAGYTLLELLIAMGLASAVMVGIFGLLSSMIKFQVEHARRTTVDSWAIASTVAMNKEIEDSSALIYPATNLAADDKMLACQNWSNSVGAGGTGAMMYSGVDTYGKAAQVKVVFYCYDATNKNLLHYNPGSTTYTSCPAVGSMPACTTGAANMEVVATKVDRLNLGAAKVFTRENTINGVHLQYQVGVQSTGNLYNPGSSQVINSQYLQFDTRITLERSYLTAGD